jgi:hypothetical protein
MTDDRKHMSKCKQNNEVGTMKLFQVVTIVKEYSGCKNAVSSKSTTMRASTKPCATEGS